MSREQKRKLKKRQRETKQSESIHLQKTALKAVLSQLGFPRAVTGNVLKALPPKILLSRARPTKVHLDPSAAADGGSSVLQNEIRAILSEPYPDTGSAIPFAWWCSGLMMAMGWEPPGSPADRQNNLLPGRAPGKDRPLHWLTLCNQGMEWLAERIYHSLVRHSRMDQGLYWCRRDLSIATGIQLTLGLTAPERTQVTLNGDRRSAFRCGGAQCTSSAEEAFPWVSWPGSVFGDSVAGTSYPVYVQRHVMDRLTERLDLDIPVNLLLDHLFWSLEEPEVIRTQGGDDVMVAYRVNQHRLGYLWARRISGVVVVRTFLSLTMDGTPEAELLYRNQGLRRADIEYHGLGRLSKLVHTDIRDDPTLVSLFEKCGCGHLFNFIPEDPEAPYHTGDAQQLKDYLGLSGRPGPAVCAS